jgi:hypothetical protein
LKTLLIAGLAALLASAFGVAGAAYGKDPEVRRSGRCSGASVWKLKLKLDDGRIETEYEVDQNRVGQRWSVVLRDNGRVVFRGLRSTRAPSGSFTVERRLPNRAGSDRITARARNLRSGEVCGCSARL